MYVQYVAIVFVVVLTIFVVCIKFLNLIVFAVHVKL
jgi:hypothetical protein